VGSGKTVVALLTLLLAVEGGHQGALMAPTEILAEQHYRRFVEWLTPLGLKVGLCLGKHTTKQRQEVLTGLANGQIHLAVGTHALIQDGVVFNNLGVVIIDAERQRPTPPFA
jgi:ATP-dependent DNA helicase RecG